MKLSIFAGTAALTAAITALTFGGATAHADPAAEPAAASTTTAAPPPAAAADDGTAGKKIGVGADLAFALPLGKWGDVSGLMIGALVKGQFTLSESLALTARAGYIYGLSKEPAPGFKFGVSYVPVWVGAKFFFMGKSDGLYGAAELGLNYLMARTTVTFLGQSADASSSEAKFGANVGLGFQMKALDFRGQLQMLDLGHAGDSMAVMINAGYQFVAF